MIVHQGWNPLDFKYDHDIAILRMTHKVEFSKFIQPICILFTNTINVNRGKIVGWGVTDEKRTFATTAKVAKLEVKDALKCVVDHPMLSYIAWKESFCAESMDVGVCEGDSGSGFYVEIKNRFYLKGILSSSASSEHCSANTLALYTDMTKYYDFVEVRSNKILDYE